MLIFITQGILMVALALFGLADTVFGLRRRFGRPAESTANPFHLITNLKETTMEVILLERVAKLGQMGETVKVRAGYARNFLLPRGKALRATKANKKHFETQRAQLEARNLERRKEAEVVGEKLNGQSFIILRQSGETGVLYGSVSTRDLAEIDDRRTASRSTATRSPSTSRSRPSACTTCRSPSTRRSRFR